MSFSSVDSTLSSVFTNPRDHRSLPPTPPATRQPRKLILCFDGTGNAFTGTPKDTNVVKLLSMLDRNDPNQYHYYQTGIGTYDVNETSVNKSTLAEMQSKVWKAVDQGFGTTFDAHVMAGYRFLMNYYETGDKIYMFGFSRGAFTAKFLARMIHHVGLLCRGNEEMVPFAYRLYQSYLAGETRVFEDEHCAHGKKRHHSAKKRNEQKRKSAHDELRMFSRTFCWREKGDHCGGGDEYGNVKVFFLGLWDCVNSVAVLEKKTPLPVAVRGTAHHVRHAVAVDERRVKFKPALFEQDRDKDNNKHKHDKEDILEVWFPGNHGDVGGGWHPVDDKLPTDNKLAGIWSRIKLWWNHRGNVDRAEPSGDEQGHEDGCDACQLSDIPLAWMVREIQNVGIKNPEAAVKWGEEHEVFEALYQRKKEQAVQGSIHDPLMVGFGLKLLKVLMWNFLEFLPLIKRWELRDNDSWEWTRWPVNRGATRKIPRTAILHDSLLRRLTNDDKYHPPNSHGGGRPCLKDRGVRAKVVPVNTHGPMDIDHITYHFEEHILQTQAKAKAATEAKALSKAAGRKARGEQLHAHEISLWP